MSKASSDRDIVSGMKTITYAEKLHIIVSWPYQSPDDHFWGRCESYRLSIFEGGSSKEERLITF